MSDMATIIKPPVELKKSLYVPDKLLMGPGPSNCPSRVMNASSLQMLGHLDSDFIKIMDEVKLGIKYAFQTSNKMTFAVSGTGHCAMETAICNVIEPGDVFLVSSSGIWGERAMEMGERIGANCHQMNISAEDVLQLDKLKEAVALYKPVVIFICHGDSSTGTLQPLEKITNFIKGLDTICIVDCVASLGAAPVFMDNWGIDVLYSGSQKILNAPPGLSPISFSAKAEKKIRERKTPVTSFYMDALLIANYWRCDDKPISYHHTAPINLMYALREALAILVEETLEKCWERHKHCAEILWKKLEQLDLVMFVSEKAHRLPSVTTVKKSANYQGPELVQCMKQRFNIDIAEGLGSTSGQVWRIGLMGHNCSEENVEKVSEAIKECLSNISVKSSL